MIKKHIGYLPSGVRCFVILNTVTDDVDSDDFNYCLVIEPDSLPEQYSYAVNEVIMGAAQKADNAVEVLSKATLANGVPIINLLHNGNYIRKVQTIDVTMDVGNNHTIKLSELNEQIKVVKAEQQTAVANTVTKQNYNYAQNLVVKANDMIAEANKLLNQAYSLRPELKPAAQDTKQTETAFVLKTGISKTEAVAEFRKFYDQHVAKKK